jgi:HSP20 family protein
MNRVRSNPLGILFNEVSSVQDEFARLLGRIPSFAGVPVPATTPVNVWEDDQALYVEADLPGVDPAKLDLTVTEGTHLTVQGDRPAPAVTGAAWVRQERPIGQFVREIELPALVDADKVEAKYENGVLRLTLPKHEAVKPRKIQVKGGA